MRALRTEHQLSLAELARRTRYSKSSWERWLNDRRPLNEQAVRLFAGACGVDADELVGLWQADGDQADGDQSTQAAEKPTAKTPPSAPLTNARPPAGYQPTPIAAARPRTGLPVPPNRTYPAWLRRTAMGTTACLLVLTGVGLDRLNSPASHAAPPPAPVAAPVGCRAAGCVDQDPQADGCAADAKIIAVTSIETTEIWLKYSPACQAAWVKITDGGPPDTATITSGAESETALIHYGADAYSHMVDASAP
jgi:transcriptional regulator with XRE-family HTH domain